MEELNIERVRAMLHARLSGRGINVDKVYVNGINKLDEPLVTYSQTLVWAFLLQLQDRETPYFEGEHLGLFTEPYTFDPDFRFKGLDFDELNRMGVDIAQVFLGGSVNG
ncbi:hypothetical protein [Pseudomonas moorei]|jgi:hypothetical protein|uniref:hypothetical protein n=1 Tax=Pseudomonas moorei TaxID=395599 RepID=UPI000D4A5C56|nr:hypothetical protein DBR45_43260 [Pseudomonas sp. HMWF031]